jgi:IS605 OrfB family transposase
MLAGMQLRYRYRIEPTGEQREALAKAFGCARVVYNDGLRLREHAYRAGLSFIPDAELLRLVTTEAKKSPARMWLTEVSAVILQQSVADLHRAYRNYFRALAVFKVARARGEKAVLRVHKPRFKSKHHDQAVRFTANCRFRVLPNGRLRLPKIGEVRIRWSRPLPANPSSVTVTLDRAGRYHASFVVEVAEMPLSATDDAVGIDLGLSSFAALSTGEKVVNPRWLRQRERALRRSQRNMARKQKGSMNREKVRRRLARQHAKVADARRDFHHQLSTRLVRENQAVYVETLNLAALRRSTLGKSLADAGWGQFIRMLQYKASMAGRTIIKVDRWHPSSQLCSSCGRRTGPVGLSGLRVRAWTCGECGSVHDRDINAAKNILAAGQAATACGPGARPGAGRAVGDEAGTTPEVAA